MTSNENDTTTSSQYQSQNNSILADPTSVNTSPSSKNKQSPDIPPIPPPLPPFPSSISSRYLRLTSESKSIDNTTNNNNNNNDSDQHLSKTTPIAIDIDNSVKARDVNCLSVSDPNERQLKGASIGSDNDVFCKDLLNTSGNQVN
jgi:hypothetical protein